MRRLAHSLAGLLCLSPSTNAVTMPDWEDQNEEVSLPLASGGPLRTLILPNGHQIALGEIFPVAGLAASDVAPGGGLNGLHQIGDGRISFASQILWTKASGDRLAVLGVAEDRSDNESSFLAMWEVDRGFRWSVAIEPDARQLAHFPGSVVTLRSFFASIEAYDASTGRSLWGGAVADELEAASAELVLAAPGLFVDVNRHGPDGAELASRLLELDPVNGARLREINLARVTGFDTQSVITVQRASNGDLWIYTHDASTSGPSRQLRAQRWTTAGEMVDERVIQVGMAVVGQWIVSEFAGEPGSIAIAQHIDTDLTAELLLIDIETAQLQWSLSLESTERPRRLWVADGQVVAQVTGPNPQSSLSVRSWRLDNGQLMWAQDLDPGAGYQANLGTWVGNSIRFPYSRGWNQSAVHVDPGSGASTYTAETAILRRSAATSGWFGVAQRLITGRLVASPIVGLVLSARAVDATDGSPSWLTQQVIAAPAVISTAATSLVGGVRADRVWAALAVSREASMPTDVHAVVVDAATGIVQRSVSRSAAGAPSIIIGMDDTLYLGHSGGCSASPTILPVVESINSDASRRWCQPAPSATPSRPFSVAGALLAGVAVGVDLADGSGQRVAMLDGSDGSERWAQLLPWSVHRTLYPRISPDRLLFRHRPFSTGSVIDGELHAGSGQLSWQSSFEPSFSQANIPASVLLPNGNWIRAVHGWSPQPFIKLQSQFVDGTLDWQSERRPANIAEATAQRLVVAPDSGLLLEIEHGTNGFIFRSLAQVDVATGNWLGERVIDAVDHRDPLGRGTVTVLVSARPSGGLAVLAAKPVESGRIDTVLQGWPAWSGTPAGNLAIGIAAKAEGTPRITSLGRHARFVLDIESAVDRPVLAKLLASSTHPVSLQVVGCAISGGSCESVAGDGQLPATIQLPAFASGQMEIDLVARSGIVYSTGGLEFMLMAGPELLEPSLDDNRTRANYSLGPYRNGFE